MTRRDDGHDDANDPRLAELVGDALGDAGELLPTTEAEVERAEAAGVEEVELPESLQELPPRSTTRDPGGTDEARTASPSARVVELADARARRGGSWLSHGVAAALGAAAATAVLFATTRTERPAGGVPSAEPVTPRADAAAEPWKLALGAIDSCPSDCCAGSVCTKAEGELAKCSSRHTCVACSIDELAKGSYRVRLGALALTDAGRAAMKAAGSFDLCVRVGSSPMTCTPAHTSSNAGDPWAVLPLLASVQDAVAGFELEVRARGTQRALGAWKSPVRLNATVLCRGLSAKPKSPKDESLGVVSVFFDDTHYVELERAERASSLAALRPRIDVTGAPLTIFETSRPGAQRFALVLGPFTKTVAENVRWKVLDQGRPARIVVGDDHVGDGRPLD